MPNKDQGSILGRLFGKTNEDQRPTRVGRVVTASRRVTCLWMAGILLAGVSCGEAADGFAPPPTPTIDGCVKTSTEVVARLAARIEPGHTLGLSYVDRRGERALVGATIYRDEDQFMVGVAALWMIEGARTYAVDYGANRYSLFTDAALLEDGPTAEDAEAVALTDNCLVRAIFMTADS